MITRRDYRQVNTVNPDRTETAFRRCNFSRAAPIMVDGHRRGTRIWPDDDTPRVLTRCVCINCEFGPNVELRQCQTSITDFDIVLDRVSFLINGVEYGANVRGSRTYGYFDADTHQVVDHPTPHDSERIG
jgi:hypothetical protein